MRRLLALLLLALPAVAIASDSPGPLATKPISGRSNVVRVEGRAVWVAGVVRRNTLYPRLVREGVTLASTKQVVDPHGRDPGEHPANKLTIKAKKTGARTGSATLSIKGNADAPAAGGGHPSTYKITLAVRWRVGAHSVIKFDPSLIPPP